MLLILSKIAVVFSLAGIGFAANKIGILPIESNNYLIPLLLDIATPCLLVTAIAGRKLTPETYSVTVIAIVGSFIFFAAGMAVSYLLVRLIRVPMQDRGIYMSIITMVNNGCMGFPVTKAAFGDDGLYLMVLCNIVLCIWTYTAGFLQVNIGSSDAALKMSRKRLMAMVNPCSVASVAGIVLLFAQIKLPEFLFSLLDTTGQISIPLSMIVVGIQLGESRFRQIASNSKLVETTIIKLVLVPALTLLAVYWLPIPQIAKAVLVLSASFPSAVNMVAVAAIEKKNATLASEGVAMTTAFSMISLPVIIIGLSAMFQV